MPVSHHQTLIKGFHGIQDKNALGWAVLDHKAELLITAAIATSINRHAQQRIAHIEFPPRIDLVILEHPIELRPDKHLNPVAGSIRMKYEAKAGQLFDFSPAEKTHPKYLGADLNAELEEMEREKGAGLFFISEVSRPNHHLKYFRGNSSDISEAKQVLCRHIPRGELVAHEVIDCGVAAGTEVKIHMCVFDPKQAASHPDPQEPHK